MQITKEYARKIFQGLPAALAKIDRIEGDQIYFELQSPAAWKTQKQNNLFHSLLQCFWTSGCASFGDYDSLRLYYKRVAGLVKKKDSMLVEGSWSEAKKEQARVAIDMLMRDMDMAGVIGSSQGKKYEEILKGIKQFYQEFY